MAPRHGFLLQKCMNYHVLLARNSWLGPIFPLPSNHLKHHEFPRFLGQGPARSKTTCFTTVWRPEIPFPRNHRKQHEFPSFLKGIRPVRKRHVFPRFGDRFLSIFLKISLRTSWISTFFEPESACSENTCFPMAR